MEKEVVYFTNLDVYYFVKDYSLRYVDLKQDLVSHISYLPIWDIETLIEEMNEPYVLKTFDEFEEDRLRFVK